MGCWAWSYREYLMKPIPVSTYRLQLCPNFGFHNARDIVQYLENLGVTDVYASPIFKASKGSLHGYDIVDPNQINPELGSNDDFEDFTAALKERGMGWIQDIVPNHMAVSYDNNMLVDVLENGKKSEYFNFFDIIWNHPYQSIRGRLLAPFLGKFYSECLESGEIQLEYDSNGFTVYYYDLRFPIRIESYPTILNYRLQTLKQIVGRNNPDFIKLLGILYVCRAPESEYETGERRDQTRFVKRILWELYTTNGRFKSFVDENVDIFNGRDTAADGFNLLHSLLSEQHFRLSFWKVTTEETNYRRFFNINSLISLRVEDENVFLQTHRLIFNLVEEGRITGLRIDHIDGLYDPTVYLRRLREKIKDLYLVVEKILAPEEQIPDSWAVDGTTGYEFIHRLNGIYCNSVHEREFSRLYSSFIQYKPSYPDLLYEKKKLLIDKHMSGDVDNLAHLLKRISTNDRYGIDITLNGLRRAIVEVLACFPIYRTYMSPDYSRPEDCDYVLDAVSRARARRPDLFYELDFMIRFLCLQFQDITEEDKKNRIRWVMRFQQLSGPLMAKGFEDTTLYVFNRLVSLNEVGGDPSKFGVSLNEFHEFNKMRFESHPHSLNASSTHDTKRGEDVRARINVLSEIPQEWEARIKNWNRLNRPKKTESNGSSSPDRNDEYFLYQTLVGSFPFRDAELGTYIARLKDYIVKATREAKVHTEWLKPDTVYENAFISFVENLLAGTAEDNMFLTSFLPFQRKIAYYGMLNSLSQVFVKIVSPGVADFYQGTELWDLNLVDPDNRRPVDFQERKRLLAMIREKEKVNIKELIQKLWSVYQDGGIKLFLIYRVLSARKAYRQLFERGDYLPLQVRGKLRNHVLAFARKDGHRWVVAVATRFFTVLVKEGELPFGKTVWQDTRVALPAQCPLTWTDAIDSKVVSAEKFLELGEILQDFHVSLLVGDTVG
jgi:(1->4)-alpha-D-glucan 1-alpha-D-glucosylmutase